MAISGASFTHPITQLAVDSAKPEGLDDAGLKKVYNRIARKAGYELHRGNQFVPQSKLSKFNYFSAGGRNANTTARAYYESGHLLTAAILRTQGELRTALKDKKPEALLDDIAETSVWTSFKSNTEIQRKFKRQDYINHRPNMLKGGETTNAGATNSSASGTTPLLKKNHTEDNRFSRIATRIAQGAMSVWECTCAPTGFGSKMVRNTMFHGVSEGGQTNKAFTIGLAFGIGLAVTTLIKVMRDASDTAGYGFNPLQILTGVLFSFAAISSLAGLVSWVAGLASQAKLKSLDPSDEQKQFIQFEMDSTLNKINKLLIDAAPSNKNSNGKMWLLNLAFNKKFTPKSGSDSTHALLDGWQKALQGKTTTTDQIQAAKEFLGRYLQSSTSKDEMLKEKEFATLAGFVEHFALEPTALNPKQAADAKADHRTPQTLRDSRQDGRQMAEAFAQQTSRFLIRGLAVPAKVIDKVCRTHLSQSLKHAASPEYSKLKAERLANPHRAHLNKYDTEYISAHLHQYGPITRALMQTSNLIHNFNNNYVLAINTQTSRIFSKLALLGQEHLIGQHGSKIMCNAFGRFLGSATVTLVSFFGISALAGFTGNGNPADGFQNMSSAGSAKFSWLVTGTLMALIGIPAFALGLMAKGAAMLEGWEGNTEKPLPSRVTRNQELLITI